MAKGKYKKKRLRRERRQCLIKSSGLPTRVIHILENEGLKTMMDLDLCPDDKLLAISGIGEKAFAEIKEKQINIYDGGSHYANND